MCYSSCMRSVEAKYEQGTLKLSRSRNRGATARSEALGSGQAPGDGPVRGLGAC
jgi:hypothetical protein